MCSSDLERERESTGLQTSFRIGLSESAETEKKGCPESGCVGVCVWVDVWVDVCLCVCLHRHARACGVWWGRRRLCACVYLVCVCVCACARVCACVLSRNRSTALKVYSIRVIDPSHRSES